MFALISAVGVALLLRQSESEEDRAVRRQIADIRATLKITRADGYILSSEKLPVWHRGRTHFCVARSQVEAAARLAHAMILGRAPGVW